MELGQGEGSRLELLPQGWRRRGRAAGLGKCQVPHYVCAPGRWHHKSEDFHKDLTDLAGQMRPQHDYRCVRASHGCKTAAAGGEERRRRRRVMAYESYDVMHSN